MSGLRQGALVQHPEHGPRFVNLILPVESGRPNRRIFAGPVANGWSFDELPDGSLSDGWVPVGVDGQRPEGARLAWVTDRPVMSDLRDAIAAAIEPWSIGDGVTERMTDAVLAVLDQHTTEVFGASWTDGWVSDWGQLRAKAKEIGSIDGRVFVSRRVTAWTPVEGDTP